MTAHACVITMKEPPGPAKPKRLELPQPRKLTPLSRKGSGQRCSDLPTAPVSVRRGAKRGVMRREGDRITTQAKRRCDSTPGLKIVRRTLWGSSEQE